MIGNCVILGWGPHSQKFADLMLAMKGKELTACFVATVPVSSTFSEN